MDESEVLFADNQLRISPGAVWTPGRTISPSAIQSFSVERDKTGCAVVLLSVIGVFVWIWALSNVFPITIMDTPVPDGGLFVLAGVFIWGIVMFVTTRERALVVRLGPEQTIQIYSSSDLAKLHAASNALGRVLKR